MEQGFPRRFGPYVLLKPLARGGMGALYLAVAGEKGMEKLCVVKTALPHLLGKGYGQRFRDEASVVVRLSHGNLVTVFDAGQVAGEIFIAMDFVDGKDLRAVWNRCAQKGVAFPIDIAVHIAKEMARGLGYVHAFKGLRLVHRDISPPNVLVSYTGEVKITDFGLAWSTLKLEKTAPGIIFGKVSYMAPEQARGEVLDGRADIYAAGIILWELLTGRQLFPAPPGSGTDDEALEKVRHPTVQPPSQRASRVPRELDEIVMKALDPNPAKRHQSGEALRADLAAFQARTAPATDGDQVARFLKDLFGDVIGNERHERETLVQDAASMLSIPTAPLDRDELLAAVKGAELPGQPGRKPGAKGASPEAARVHSGDFLEESTTAGSRHNGTKSHALESTPSPNGHAADAPSQLVGTLLAGRYRIKRLCGEGGMGRVYEAEHVEIGRRVAVKVLHPAYSRTPEVVERFRREARAASKVGHPNIVDVTDSGTTDDGSFFFVMEFIEGVELGLVIFKEGPMAIQRALHIGAQMCDALQAAHDAGIIHRDLKPENVLLITREGLPDFVKVLDFGIAKSADVEETAKNNRKLTRPGVAMGTPEYMAPEQAAGKPADPRSDIYAVGSILYEMLTATAPYDGDNVMEVLHKKANQAPTPLRALRPDLPLVVESMVDRAMARSPAARPQSMGELATELRALSSALGDDLPPPPARTPAAQRRDSPLLAGAVSGPVATMWGLSRRIVAVGAGGLALLAGLVVIRAVSRPPVAVGPASLPGISSPASPRPTSPLGPESPTQLTAAPAPVLFGPVEPPRGEPRSEAEEAARRRASRKGVAAIERQKLLKEGWALYEAQRFEDARGAFSKLMGDRRTIGSASLGLAKVAFQEHRYDEAARWARQSSRYNGGVEAAVLLGDAHYRLQQLPQARAAYREALKLNPTNQAAQRMLELVDRKLR
jgi:eukaryotic-like serine/threonine-protein kinase